MAKNDIKKIGEATRFKSGAEAVESGRKGGKASGRKRREKRAFRELIELALSTQVTNKATGEKASRKEVAAIRLAEKCMVGDIKAISLATELLGEKQNKTEHIGQVQIMQTDNRTPEEIIGSIRRMEKLRSMIEEEMREDGK